jgi:hypothetical protein
MDIDSLTKLIEHEWLTVTDAPVLFTVALLIAGAFMWKVMGWRYDGVIETKNATIDHLNKVIETQSMLQSASVSTTAVAALEAANADTTPQIQRGANSPADEPRSTLFPELPVPENIHEIDARTASASVAVMEGVITVEDLRRLYRPELNIAEQEELIDPYRSSPFIISGKVGHIGKIGNNYTIIIGIENRIGTGMQNIAFDGNDIISRYRSIRVGSAVTLQARLDSIDGVTILLRDIELLEIAI